MRKRKVFIICVVCLGILALAGMPKTDNRGPKHIYAKEVSVQNEGNQEKNCDIVFVLDISGSMKKTDSNKISVEIMKMMTDICSLQNNRVGFVGYNDTIAYSYNLTNVKDSKNRKVLKGCMENVSFRGETDIGLGLKQAVTMLQNRPKKTNVPIICLLSDGETDLTNSSTGRTEEQSEQDVADSIAVAKENGIKVYTVGLNNNFSEVVDYLEVISKQTDGESYVASSPFQLLEIINGVVESYQGAVLKNQTTELADGTIQKYRFRLPDCSLSKYRIVLLSSSKIELSGVLEREASSKHMGDSNYYSIIEVNNPTEKEMTLYYKTKKGSSVSINTQCVYDFTGEFSMPEELNTKERVQISFSFVDGNNGKNISQTDEFKDVKCQFYVASADSKKEKLLQSKQTKSGYEVEYEPQEEGKYYFIAKYEGSLGSGLFQSEYYEVHNQIPETIEKKNIELCVEHSKEFDLEKLFEHNIHKNYQYDIEGIDGKSVRTSIDGNVLKIYGDKVGKQEVQVIAEMDTERYQIIFSVEVGTFWQIYQQRIIAIAIGSVISFTILVYTIAYFIQRMKKKKILNRKFGGSLTGYFIDVKSAHDIPRMEWDLWGYPGVGITLNTLLKEVDVDDYFLGAERIWLYPCEKDRITIVHSLYGSIFLGDKLIEKNKPVQIRDGDVVYICFEENGAEIELHYRNIGGDYNDQRLI